MVKDEDHIALLPVMIQAYAAVLYTNKTLQQNKMQNRPINIPQQ
jgi:hypothetical protein